MARKKDGVDQPMSRRDLLKAGALGTVGIAAGGSVLALPGLGQTQASGGEGQASHHDMMTVGNLAPGSFDPSAFLTRFDGGQVSRLPSGQVLREYELVAEDREIEVAPGVFYPAWTYNGNVPGAFDPVHAGGRCSSESDAAPFGLALSRSHTVPSKRQIRKGPYGDFTS